MHLLKNNKLAIIFGFRQLLLSYKRCLKKCGFDGIKYLIWLAMCLGFTTLSHAEGINIQRQHAKITETGQLLVSTRFHIDLPEQLENALKQGVPLDFSLSYRLDKPVILAYRFKINQLIHTDNTVNYRLSYHPLTNRYRISVGTFSMGYNNLHTALKAVGAIANWLVLPPQTLSNHQADTIKAQVRLTLSTTKLPKPFQINALTSKDWELDSDWQTLHIQ